ncbi:hypothetical protein TruAng_001619 [Truncatella angustata]|nr:hypothetical protein TruAng_001619 [Truncatella angustata]
MAHNSTGRHGLYESANTALKLRRPATRGNFEIAIICALTLEADAVESLFDQHWSDNGFSYGKSQGDPNAYSAGAIGRHNVVLVHAPGMGKANAAAVAASCRLSFPNIKLAVVVGVCGVVPFRSNDEIVLGDIIISDALVQYDLGRRLPERFVRKDTLLDSLGRPNSEIRALLAKLKGIRSRRALHAKITNYMDILRSDPALEAEYPGIIHDKLFEATYHHTGDGMSCDECGCDGQLVPRSRLTQSTPQPTVHFGLIASGDTVMKSGEERNAIARQENVIGFEMEGAGVWDSFPCVVIKGACDYADSHKTKIWQRYAAAAAAAYPGCGKSVLAKFLVDEVLPSRGTRTTCYFFFKDDFEDQKSLVGAIRCILYQILRQKPAFLSDRILDRFKKGREEIFTAFKGLWEVLVEIASGDGSGEVVCILDGLDECEAKGQLELFLVTSRPYAYIQREFQILEDSQPTIHLSGENQEEVEKISREIDIVIEARLNELSATHNHFHPNNHVWREELTAVENRTYLWVHLIFNVITEDTAIFTVGDLRENIRNLPRTVEAAYDKILCRSHHVDRAKKLLHMVVAADRPLSLAEMAMALAITESHHSYNDLQHELLPPSLLHETVREACGLFIVIKDSKIYLLHQTAREFLVQLSPGSATEAQRSLKWQSSLCLMESNKILSEICMWYLLLADFKKPIDSANYSQTYWTTIGSKFPESFDALMIASYFGLNQVVDLLLRTKNIDLTLRDTTYKRSALSWASENGHSTIVKSLLCRVPKYKVVLGKWLPWMSTIVNAKDAERKTPLCWAAQAGHEAVVQMLLEEGAEIEGAKSPMTPLVQATIYGHEAIVQILLEKGASIEVGSPYNTPLGWAAMGGREVLIQMLLEKGAYIEAVDRTGRTPLGWAVEYFHEPVIRILLEKGANIEARNCGGWTPLGWAAAIGREAIVQILLKQGANIEVSDCGVTPLGWAAAAGQEIVVQMLLDNGAYIEARDNGGRTPLEWAAENGQEAVVQMLLEKGANIEGSGPDGWTPLGWAARSGREAVVKLLLEKGANIDANDRGGWTPLGCAVRSGHKAIIQLLLGKGADIETKSKNGITPLESAIETGHRSVASVVRA